MTITGRTWYDVAPNLKTLTHTNTCALKDRVFAHHDYIAFAVMLMLAIMN